MLVNNHWLPGLMEGVVGDKSRSHWKVVSRRMTLWLELSTEEWIMVEQGDKSGCRENKISQ